MKDWTGWGGFVLSVAGVSIQSLLPHELRWSFVVFSVANVFWFGQGWKHGNRPLMAKQAVLGVLNTVAMIHWFYVK